MSDFFAIAGEHRNGEEVQAPNGQLITPALSPISEHGDRSLQPFPGYDADDEWVRSPVEAPDTTSINGLGISGNAGIGSRKSSNVSGTSKLSPQQIHDLVSSPESLPVRAIDSIGLDDDHAGPTQLNPRRMSGAAIAENESDLDTTEAPHIHRVKASNGTPRGNNEVLQHATSSAPTNLHRPAKGPRSASTPMMRRSSSGTTRMHKEKPILSQVQTDSTLNGVPKPNARAEVPASPLPHLLPLPPLSLPTYLQLELSSDRPSALYLHRSSSADFPYESSKVKFERLYNFLLVPGYVEQVLWFGAVVCLDAWLYTFTILPLRFLKALTILLRWWGRNALKEAFDLAAFVYSGVGRLRERRQLPATESRRPSLAGHDASRSSSTYFEERTQSSNVTTPLVAPPRKTLKPSRNFVHRRTRSTPSALLPNHKADILQGCLIMISCYILMWFDASRMYHNIRGQSAIKLYVIYNVLEVFDRLFAALGQDILECLFSKETLERGEDGRSKVIRPFWMFILALVYNVVHSTALFYQCITLNVAVNSYSNALLTLLMSNQFVEIKGTVFKKFEKENLFQITCADVVERFQLWLMLLIIALRNIVEIGGLSISITSAFGGLTSNSNSVNGTIKGVPLMGGIVIPQAFTLMPKWTGEVLGPFLIVLGSEMLVDWCKHAYITKFNNVKPKIYGRFFDVLAKDYYSHAFADQNLTKRLGLPVIPLSCLFIRACVQTYHMLLAIHVPPPIPSPATSISLDANAASTSPVTLAAIKHIDQVFRRALGRSSFGAGQTSGPSFNSWSLDDVIALGTMVTCFLALYLVLLALKLVLGICLLSISRSRYRGMKEREHEKTNTDGRRMGGWGMIEVGDERRRWIYEDDPHALKQLYEKEDRGRRKSNPGDKLDTIDRYSMVAKRIW